MSTMADKFEELGVIPVVVLNNVEDAKRSRTRLESTMDYRV